VSHRPRRAAVLGRTSCLHCHLMLRHPSGLCEHARRLHPETLFDYTPRIVKKDRRKANGDQRVYCYTQQPPKLVYDTRDAAWVGAMTCFVQRGWILTPYFCCSRVHRTPNGLPKYLDGCGRWHLSRGVVRMLPAG